MAFIETHQSLPTHRKTLRLARVLKIDRFSVVGRLVALWGWALDNAQEGVIGKDDSDIVADVMGWDGDGSALCAALVSVGFFDEHDDHYEIHDWWDYAGRLILQRRANAEKQRAWRDRQREGRGEEHETDTSPSAQNGHNHHVTVTLPQRDGATVPNRTVPNRTVEDLPSSEVSLPAVAEEEVVTIPREETAPARRGQDGGGDAEDKRLATQIAGTLKMDRSAIPHVIDLFKQYPRAPDGWRVEAASCAEWYREHHKPVTLRTWKNWLERDEVRKRAAANHDGSGASAPAGRGDPGAAAAAAAAGARVDVDRARREREQAAAHQDAAERAAHADLVARLARLDLPDAVPGGVQRVPRARSVVGPGGG